MIGDTLIAAPGVDRYSDVRFTVCVPAATRYLWFEADGENRYFECREEDNVLWLGVE